MKVSKVKGLILKNMVEQFYKNGNEIFTFDTVKKFVPDEPDHIINKALYSLQGDSFISICSADNIAYINTLLADAIINIDENTLLQKGYTLAKEIKSFL